MLSLWNKPCPVQLNPKSIIGHALLVGAFVALFLFFFQPFGIHEIAAESRFIILAGYGLITTAVMLLFGISLHLYMKQDPGREARWTVSNQIAYVLAQISTIAAANFFYSAAIALIPYSLESLIFYIGVTFAIGLFPTVTLTLYGYAHALKKHLAVAAATNRQLEHRATPTDLNTAGREIIHLSGENKDEAIQLNLQDLLYIAAAGNYTEIHQCNGNEIKKSLLRSSLSRLEDQLGEIPLIARCHRSYLVNLEQVIRVSGNAQGYQLHLKGSHQRVPVGRSFAKKILEQISQKGFAVYP
ncbi:LytTR family DNA-binding domain-containing protein [Cesiribacter sp. SM1]|uniref:LytTR family DNA-binding domain-containing protein n=1 Tax=Cesiribacter sp. SM1 TaxID=2861196 RepID=UPI001CD60BF0|nr:LytTR family DNA-binding domain-containing protein [Cesiribacter sp. SM1]